MVLHRIPLAPNDTTRFYLDGNRIDSIPPDIFNNTPRVLVLNLMKNLLPVVNSSVFCPMPNLQKLILSHNKITSLSIMIEGGCQLLQLKVLDLSGNKLHNITSNIQHFAPNLEIFNLSLNDISLATVDWGFATMTALNNLDFYGNPLHQLKANDFAPLRHISLEVLGLKDCRLVAIEDGAFTGLTNLTSLTLSSNPTELKTMERVLQEIGNHSKLTHLDLSQMDLVNLTVPLLGSFHQLVHLNVANSMLYRVDPKLFSILTNLETLTLDDNMLDKLEGLSQLQQLRRLYLRGNKLLEVELSNLKNLEQVDVSGNHLTAVPTDWLYDVDNIQLLNASHNLINNVNDTAFQKITLHSLDLSHNKLTILHNMGVLQAKKLDVSHNNISSLSEDVFDTISSSIEELDLSHNNISTFPQHQFSDFTSLQQLNLAHNNLGAAFCAGQLEGFFQSLSHLQILDLSYNNISVLSHNEFQYLHHLTMLYLRGNNVRDLAELSLGDMKSLAKLVVSDNELHSVTPDVLGSLSCLEVVDLSVNPYECSCSILPYLHWLNTTEVTVLDIDIPSRYRCDFPPSASQERLYILSYSPNPEDCLQPTTYFRQDVAIIVIPAACLLLAIIFVIIVFCYGKVCHRIKSLHYRWQIRYREVSGVEFNHSDPKV